MAKIDVNKLKQLNAYTSITKKQYSNRPAYKHTYDAYDQSTKKLTDVYETTSLHSSESCTPTWQYELHLPISQFFPQYTTSNTFTRDYKAGIKVQQKLISAYAVRSVQPHYASRTYSATAGLSYTSRSRLNEISVVSKYSQRLYSVGENTWHTPTLSYSLHKCYDRFGIIKPGIWVKQGDTLVCKRKPQVDSRDTPEEQLLYDIFTSRSKSAKDYHTISNNATSEYPEENAYIFNPFTGIYEYTMPASGTKQQLETNTNNDNAYKDTSFILSHDIQARVLQTYYFPEGHETQTYSGTPTFLYHNARYVKRSRSRLHESVNASTALHGHQRNVWPDTGTGKSAEEDNNQAKAELHTPTLSFSLQQPDTYDTSASKARQLTHQATLEYSKTHSKKDTRNTGTVIIYLIIKRPIQIGDKLAGRHGNKGIVSNILPQQDMPYISDGTPLDILLNPLGVPSRMNVGQVYECLLGIAGKSLHENYRVKPFDESYGKEISRGFVYSKLLKASYTTNLPWLFYGTHPGKTKVFDGRSGEVFEHPITVGISYILKLVHLVDEKMHARSTGPYSLITQQPLKGRSKHGGQRLGEMEVWAFEGFGASYLLQEMMTIKSDDLYGRNLAFRDILRKNAVKEGSIPESFRVLAYELRALCFDIIYTDNLSRGV